MALAVVVLVPVSYVRFSWLHRTPTAPGGYLRSWRHLSAWRVCPSASTSPANFRDQAHFKMRPYRLGEGHWIRKRTEATRVRIPPRGRPIRPASHVFQRSVGHQKGSRTAELSGRPQERHTQRGLARRKAASVYPNEPYASSARPAGGRIRAALRTGLTGAIERYAGAVRATQMRQSEQPSQHDQDDDLQHGVTSCDH